MSNVIEVGKTDELKNGTMKGVTVQGHEILLAMIKHRYYAGDNRCPHRGGKLSKGKLAGTVVTCPLHGSQFDLRDGHVVRWLGGTGVMSTLMKVLNPTKKLTVYQVKVNGDKIRVEI